MVIGGLIPGAIGGASVVIVINAVDNFTRTFSSANKQLALLGAGITAVGIAGAFVVGGLIKMAGEFEQTNIAFTTMLGSTEKAQELLQELADFAAKTPFQIPEVEKNAKLLLAMGIETKKILPTMKALGDVAAGLSVPLERIALNFGQVKTQSKLTGRELRDFNIAGVPLLQEIAKNMGLTEQAIKDMVSTGDIGFDIVEEAFISMSSEGGKFFDLMDAQSKTFLGRISNIQDSFIQVGRTMGEVFLPAATMVAENLEILVGWFQEHPTVTKFGAAVLGISTAMALIIGPLLILKAIMPFIIANFATFVATTLPISGIILGIIGILVILGSTFFMIRDNMDEFKIGVALIWNDIVGFFESGVNNIIEALNILIRAFNSVASKLGFKKGLGEIGSVSLGRIDIDAIIAQIEANKEITEEIEKQNKGLTDQERLIASGFKVLRFGNERTGFTFSDIFDPRAFSRSEFQSAFNFEQANRGGGVIINIDNVQGLDPDEVARALEKILRENGNI